MGWLRRLANRFDMEERAAPPTPPTLAATLGDFGSDIRMVTPHTAENLATVLACVGAISSAIASLPCFLYRRDGKARVEDPGHPLARLIREGPNQHQSWPDFVEFLVASALLRGNALAAIDTDNAGNLRGLTPVPWPNVSMQMLPTGRIVYDVVQFNALYGGTGKPRRLLQGEALHILDRSDDGLVGRSRLSRAAASFSVALAVQQYAGTVYEAPHPAGMLKLTGKLNDDGMARLATQFRQAFSGVRNAARALILEHGTDWANLGGISPEDAELLMSRRFSAEELARIFQCPPPLVGIWDHSSFTNSETAGRWFASFTLTPWVRKIEAAVARTVFTEAERQVYELEFDLSGLTRGDYAARWSAHKIAVDGKILTPNEVREVEGWNPRDGGDEFGSPPVVGAA